jgi:integrase/recombinase XerD
MKQAPVLSDQDEKRVLGWIMRSSYAARNRAMFMLSWRAGMRVGEIAALRVQDVLAEDGSIREQAWLQPAQTKGCKGRIVLFNAELRRELAAYVSSIGGEVKSGPLFKSKRGIAFSANGLCQRFLAIYDAAGLETATSHSGRRSFITTLAHKGVSVRVLAALAGHQSIATTQRYIELNDHVLRTAVELV